MNPCFGRRDRRVIIHGGGSCSRAGSPITAGGKRRSRGNQTEIEAPARERDSRGLIPRYGFISHSKILEGRRPRLPWGQTSIARGNPRKSELPLTSGTPGRFRVVHHLIINDDLQANSIFFFFPPIDCGSV